MANEMTVFQQKQNAFIAAMNDKVIQAQIRRSLKDGSGAFMASMIDLFTSEKTLQDCDPAKVVAECVKAAALNLPLVKSLGFAYVVPYKNVPTFIIGYKGVLQLAQRTKQYQTINADVVYEGELVGFDKLRGMIDLSGERKSDKVIGYFAYFKTIYGFEKVLYMTKEEAQEWGKKYSKTFSSSYSPWQTEFDKMALKTVLLRLIRTYGIMSTELADAITQDTQETVSREIEQNANSVTIDIQAEVVDTETGEVTDSKTGDMPSF